MAVSKERITVYNLADLKNTSDDAIPNYLNSLRFTQSHTLTDVRLALGYAAFLVAAACFAWDYRFGFEPTKHYTAAAVALYTLLNAALTLWIWLREKGIVYVGTSPSGETITIATETKKNTPIYHLTATITSAAGNNAPSQSITLSRSFTEWFDAAGHFVATPFQTMLASNVSAVGRLDPKRAAAAGGQQRDLAAEEVLDAMIAGSASAETTGSAAKKGGKRRNKA